MENLMLDQTPLGASAIPAVNDGALRVLNQDEMNDVSGGFVCGGFCLAGLAFGAGALFGSGVAIGYHISSQ